MCAFFGIHRRSDGPALDAAWLGRRLAHLAHRGPDARATFVRGTSGFAAARLRIQGDERGDPPLRSADGRIALAFNGEIFDPGPMRRLVGAAGLPVPDPQAGDGPLLANALAALTRLEGGLRGPRLAALLDGHMAALAAWDLVRGELWLARDPLGVKPLFVLEAEGAFLYASELKPLLEVVPAARRPDLDGMAELLHLQRPGRHLPFEGVERLRPGAVWRVSPGGRITRWAGGHGIRDRVDRGAETAETAARRLGEALEDAVRRALTGGPPPCLFLSGGLDSGAVAVFGRGAPRGPALTGRFGEAGGDLDESVLAATSAAAGGWRHEIVDLDERDLVGDLASVIEALEIPMAGPGALALWRMARRAKAHSRVVLTGTGGDELLGGYARTALVLGLGGPWTRGYEGLAARIEAAGVDSLARRFAAVDRSRDLVGLLSPEFGRELAGRFRSPLRPGEGVDASIHDEVEGTLPMLLDVEDRILMAHGLEGRPALCLGDVPSAAARVPVSELVGPDGEGKRALRRALRGVLPDAVRLDRKKRGFPTPFARAARGPGRELALAMVTDRRFRERGWWNVPACLEAFDGERALHDRGLYALLSWELWARAFLDGDAMAREDSAR